MRQGHVHSVGSWQHPKGPFLPAFAPTEAWGVTPLGQPEISSRGCEGTCCDSPAGTAGQEYCNPLGTCPSGAFKVPRRQDPTKPLACLAELKLGNPVPGPPSGEVARWLICLELALPCLHRQETSAPLGSCLYVQMSPLGRPGVLIEGLGVNSTTLVYGGWQMGEPSAEPLYSLSCPLVLQRPLCQVRSLLFLLGSPWAFLVTSVSHLHVPPSCQPL